MEIEWGGRKLKLETGHMARQADAAGFRPVRRDQCARHRRWSQRSRKPGIDFFPADRELPGADLRGRARSRAATSSAKAARPRRRRSTSRLIDRSDPALCSSRASRTKCRSSSPCSRTIWRTIPTSSAWSRLPRRPDALGRCRSSARSAPRASAMIDGQFVLEPDDRRDGREHARPRRRRHRTMPS